MDMKPPTATSMPKSKGRWKIQPHPACLPVFVKYEHYTKVFLEGHDYFQDGEGSEESMDWLCGRMRNKTKCTAQLKISVDGKFSRLRSHNHKAASQGLVETTSWASYKKSLAEVFARRCEKKKKGDKMFLEGMEYVCKSSGKGRCYWSCVEHATETKCNARIATWYDGVIVKVTGDVHNHKPPELTPGQRLQQEYDEWFHKQWTAPQPTPPPPKPAQQPPPMQLKRPMMMKPLAPKPRPASPPQPPPPPPEVCLRWNSYHSNMQATFPALLNNEQFVDVTLACEGRSIKCHKMILSACSSYFDELLSQNPCQHPIVLMKDLKFWEVQALVEFMYRGEVNVAQDKLPFLLAAAEALQIKGLASPASSTPQADEDSMSLGMEADYLDDIEVPSPSSARRSRKRRTIAAMPVRTTPSPAPVPAVRSARLQRNTNHIQQQQQQQQPSTSGYVPTVSEPPTRKRRLEGPEYDPGDNIIREIKMEPVDIDASSDSMDQPSELFTLTCEPATAFRPTDDHDDDHDDEQAMTGDATIGDRDNPVSDNDNDNGDSPNEAAPDETRTVEPVESHNYKDEPVEPAPCSGAESAPPDRAC